MVSRKTKTCLFVCACTAALACSQTSKRGPVAPTTTPAAVAAQDDTPSDAVMADSEVERAVKAELAYEPAVRSDQIGVISRNGVVELRGTVDNLLAAERAVDMARAVRGVRVVVDRIDVRPPRRTDEEIRRDVGRALVYDSVADAWDVNYEVENGEVTVKGRTQSWPERRQVERVIGAVLGVKSIINDIVVDTPRVRGDREMEEEVLARLRWDALVDAGLVDVDVEHQRVRLSGTVGSAAEKQRAYLDAWTAGVEAVDDEELRVDWAVADEYRRHEVVPTPTDVEIEDAINDAAFFDPRVRADQIDPKVEGRMVTLTGEVGTVDAYFAAESLARSVIGVLAVDNRLKIAPRVRSDAELEEWAKDALEINALTTAAEIDVDVENAHATLSGTVESQLERDEAETVVARLNGIRSIDNELQVVDTTIPLPRGGWITPYYSHVRDWTGMQAGAPGADEILELRILDRLRWMPALAAGQVEVDVEAGHVTLQGSASTLRQIEVATRAAYLAGATHVDNLMQLR